MTLTYRKAVYKDLPRIIALLREDELGALRESSSTDLDERYGDAFQKIDKDPNQYLMVVEEKETIIATCHLTLMPSLTFIGSMKMQIEAVRVAEHYRSRKIGEWMLRQAMAYAKEHGVNTIQLTTNNKRGRAKNFYEKLGFEASHVGMKLHLREDSKRQECKKIKEPLISLEEVFVRPSVLSDVDALVSLSRNKRLNYEKTQPQFWRYAGVLGDQAQRKWFQELLTNKDYLMFTAAYRDRTIPGFIIGRLMPAPEVYNPEGLTLMVDDFCMDRDDLWQSVGRRLIETIRDKAKAEGATQFLVVSGVHDTLKKEALKSFGLDAASEWWVGPL